jgi:hypothetical protein
MPPNPADLPPGIAAFLLNDCRFGSKVVGRCLLELAAEGVVRLDPQPDGAPLVSLAGSREPRTGRRLMPFEDIIVGRVGDRTHGPIPLTVLLAEDGDGFTRWRKQLEDALGAQAKQDDLAKVQTGRSMWWLVLSGVAGTVIATLVPFLVYPAAAPDLIGLPFYAVFGAGIAVVAARRWRPTAAGEVAAKWWRGHDGLGGMDGTGQLVQPVYDQFDGVAAVQRADVPLPKGHVWSAVGGEWHPVKVGALPKRPFLGTTGSLSLMIIGALCGSAVSAVLGLLIDDFPVALVAASAPLAAGAIVVSGVWRPARSRVQNLPDNATFTGQVVKRWTVVHNEAPDTYRCCIDDGHPQPAPCFEVSSAEQERLHLGDTVQVTYSLRNGRVRAVDYVDSKS